MKRPDYCLPIIEPSKGRITDLINQNKDDYRYFEVWLDYVDDPDPVFLKDLSDLAGDGLIVTFRRQRLEPPRMPADRRRELLDALAETQALVDLDIGTQADDLDYLKNTGEDYRLITSFHDYEATPNTLQLEEIVDTMRAYRPAVYKLSTLCRTEGDAVRLMQLLLNLKAAGLSAVVSGMGESGLVTRVFGPVFGSEMAFAPLGSEAASAPGQLTRQQLETIYKELSD